MRPSHLGILGLALLAVACKGEQAELTLTPRDGSKVQATAHLQEVVGKSGKVITARLTVADPDRRALVGALVKGRCAAVGGFVDTIQIADVPGHLRSTAPTKLAELKGTHAIGLFASEGFTEEATGAPIACIDL